MAYSDDIYSPLDQSRRQIRLMRLRYGETDDIDCQLRVFSLDNKAGLPEYKALSYCWTKGPPICEIRLNGQSSYIRSNLHEYLKIMYAEQQSYWIFIDALCINQDNVAEQSSQVTLMGEIYRNAGEVIAWMGVTWAIEESHEYATDDRGVLLSDSLLSKLESEERYTSIESVKAAYFRNDTTLIQTKAFDRLLLEIFVKWSFWSRVWIVQGVTLARVLTLQFRRFRIDGELLLALDSTSFLKSELFEDADATMIHICIRRADKRNGGSRQSIFLTLCLYKTFMVQRQELQRENAVPRHVPVISAVMSTSGQQCSRPYDKVFGLLGLTESQMAVDYSISHIELYLRVLIKGILESELVDNGRLLEPALPWYELRDIFCSTLLWSFDLSIWNPAVHSATTLALMLCEASGARLPSTWLLDRCQRWSNPKPLGGPRWLESALNRGSEYLACK